MEGILYLVATPIGNLEDITARALRILREVDIVAAEDTRHTRQLLNHFQIPTPLTSYFEHNKRSKGEVILALLAEGKSVALVSDAGMPGISDPGEDIVRQAVAAGIQVCPVPGPCAALAGLTVSGLPTSRFVFEGFLPREKKERRQRLLSLAAEERTVIFYESPHRLCATLTDLESYFPGRQLAAAREITKKFEEIIRGSTGEVRHHFTTHLPRGEFTLVLAGAPAEAKGPPTEAEIINCLEEKLLAGLSKKEAVKAVAQELETGKSTVYRLSLDLETDDLSRRRQ